MKRNFNGAFLAIVMVACVAVPVLAKRGNDLVVTDGQGEQVVVKHGFFGHNTEIVKDRLGDGYATKKGWFGTKEQDVKLLGNTFSDKKGILGGSTISGSTIFGDKIQTKKGIFGRRTTTVDMSGTSAVLHGLWQKNKDSILGRGPSAGNMGAPAFNNQNGPAPGMSSLPPAPSN